MKTFEITGHKNSILNPDIVEDWFNEDKIKHFNLIIDRAKRAKALLSNVKRFFSSEFDRAQRAVELWDYFAIIALNFKPLKGA